MDDPGFTALSTRLRRCIDNAFDSAAGSTSKSSNHSRKKHKPDPVQSSGFTAAGNVSPGGFLIEDAGGFVLEGHDSCTPNPVSIPLSSVPTALRLLGLPPDDEEVLSVFQNAASGWGTSLDRSRNISKKDWRAVCAALLEAEDTGGSSGDGSSAFHSETAPLSGQEDDGDPDSDEYHMSVDEEEASDEYQDDTPASRKPRDSSKSVLNARLDAGQLNAKQRAECREEFARFFPDVPDGELDCQKIMIRDVTRVANLLKEKIKAEEIIEMLDAFSTSPDKSMNLQDFARMMIATKLI
ncbi:hypothetical protein M405DRAFT_816368, partial [Rhizopogon salebrosus TDB-379]